MSNPLPKGLHHLETTVKHKFTTRFSPRVVPSKEFILPKNRIERWNIRQGDQVRLLVGKKQDKFVDEKGKEGGYKIHEVAGVLMDRNRVLLKDVVVSKASPIQPPPPGYENMSDEEKNRYDNQVNSIKISKPIHYSNVQLYLGEDGSGESVFASRVSTSAPLYDKVTRRVQYERYAAAPFQGKDLGGFPTDEKKGLVKIAWPELKSKAIGDAGPTETVESTLKRTTATPLPTTSLWTSPSLLPLPASSRASSAHLPRAVSDAYISSTISSAGPSKSGEPLAPEEVDTFMPLYLTEELSPRFSRAKATEGWNLRKQQEAREREEYAERAVEEWKASGRDAGLSEVAAQAGLAGVSIRPRTVSEVRDAAKEKYGVLLEDRARLARMAKRAGNIYVPQEDGWRLMQSQAEKLSRKAKRERRRVNAEKRLETLVL